MKKTYKYIALAALALGFTACSQDDDFAPQQEDIVKIASANIATEVQTRVNTLGDGTAWETGDRILLVNNSRTTKNSGTYEATVTTSTTWALKDGLVLYHSLDANSFTAYYPAKSEADYTLPADQSTTDSIKYADRMTATATGVAKGAAVALSFKRQNAMVSITPSFNTEFGDDATISSLQIAGITSYYPADAEDYKAIIAPATGFEVSVKVKVGETEQTLTATTSTAIEAGKHYTFNLTVGKEAVSITALSVSQWTELEFNDVETEWEAFDYDSATNSYNVYSARGLQTAIDAVELTGTAESPAKVTLLADMEVTGKADSRDNVAQDILVDNGAIVLDLNGHTITSADAATRVIMVDDGAMLTINDSSEGEQGKIITTGTAINSYNGKLVVNGGNIEGVYAIQGFNNNSIIEINGGTFKGTTSAVDANSSILTITDGTFTGDGHALSVKSPGKPTITGGTFSGGDYDIFTSGPTGFLSYNAETGEGPTFPSGFSIKVAGEIYLNTLLATGAAYFDAEGNQLTLASTVQAYDEGDVTVKKIN